jgi:hypothetical protein
MCDNCRQLETDIERYRKLLERSPNLLIIEIQRFRKLLDLGLGPLAAHGMGAAVPFGG